MTIGQDYVLVFAKEVRRREKRRQILRALALFLGAYLGTCFSLSTITFVLKASGAPGGEYIPLIHWPLKLMVSLLG